jgi:hypothetical protein
MDKPKPITPGLTIKLFKTLDQLIDRWVGRGYCPHCLTRNLLLHAGIFAAHELGQDEMREALSYIAKLSAEHCPTQEVTH